MYQVFRLPVSVKGIVFEQGGVWLRKNEREEWELPGGKLEVGEQPTETVVREMQEELGLHVEVLQLVQAYTYVIPSSIDETKGVLVISYLCRALERSGDFEWQGEAGPADFKLFSIGDIEDVSMPPFYKEAIKTAWSISQ